MRRDIRLLILGDEQVGKTSIVTSLLTQTFTPDVPHVLPEISIPPHITPDNVNTIIVDSSARPEDRLDLEREIRQAQVICLVYAVEDPKTFARVPTYWLPYIRSLGVSVPVVLVGNKIDTRGANVTNEALEDEILPIMNDFKEVETCVECSARSQINIVEVFYFAQKSVLHPTAPLYDSREQNLKPTCAAALRRIFKLCDLNKDGILDDEELNDFQIKCFGTPLQKLELEGIKDLVRQADLAGVERDGLTREGFLYLHKLFIQRGRLETTWTVLRRFGYDDDLALREDFLHPTLSVPADCTVELSPVGYQFFAELFAKFDKDKDGALSWEELEDLFSTAPENPWLQFGFPETTLTNENGAVTLQGFLAQWSMTTLLDHKTTLEYLAYLGFTSDTRTGLRVVRGKRFDSRKHRNRRDVFLCLVVGASGSGKTSLLRSLINRPFDAGYVPTPKCNFAVNSVEIGGAEKYLVMMEVSQHQAQDQLVLSDPNQMANFDVVCYVYDSSDPNSFGFIASLREKFEDLVRIPSIVVASKSDLDRVSQRFEVQPDQYCKKLSLPSPISVSAKEGILANLFQTVVSVAMDPALALPTPFTDKYRRQIVTGAIITAVALTALTTTFFILRSSRR